MQLARPRSNRGSERSREFPRFWRPNAWALNTPMSSGQTAFSARTPRRHIGLVQCFAALQQAAWLADTPRLPNEFLRRYGVEFKHLVMARNHEPRSHLLRQIRRFLPPEV